MPETPTTRPTPARAGRTEKAYQIGEAARLCPLNPTLFRFLLLSHQVPVHRPKAGTRVQVPESSIDRVRTLVRSYEEAQYRIEPVPDGVAIEWQS